MTKNKLPKYKTQDNADLYPKVYDKIDPISITIPNETYSLREIVEKFSKSYPTNLQRNGYYDDTEDFDDIDVTRQPDFDLVDAMELKNALKQKTVQKIKKEQKMSSSVLKNEQGENTQNHPSQT